MFDLGPYGVNPFELIDSYVEAPWLQNTLKAGVVIIGIGIMLAFLVNVNANDDDC